MYSVSAFSGNIGYGFDFGQYVISREIAWETIFALSILFVPELAGGETASGCQGTQSSKLIFSKAKAHASAGLCRL